MRQLNRREVLALGSAAALATASPMFAAASNRTRVFIASHEPTNGILAYDWDDATGQLTAVDPAADVSTAAWLALSPNKEFLFSASELDNFQGKPTGGITSFRVRNGNLQQLSTRNSAATGTCHLGIDHTGRMLLSADYTGASAASFRITDGHLSPIVWKQHYTEHGPNPVRQPTAHAHYASFSPDNRFAYINDLGGDCIHIYRPDPATAQMKPAGKYQGAPGSGPRTLHFHPNGRTAYCVNEIVSTVDVLDWHKDTGNFTLIKRIELLPPNSPGVSTACDAVITRDGRFVYFANRGNDFLYAFHADPQTGALTPMRRSTCGGKTPRNFVLAPSERWMLVANQDSNWISVIARNPQTGELSDHCKYVPAAIPMRILFL